MAKMLAIENATKKGGSSSSSSKNNVTNSKVKIHKGVKQDSKDKNAVTKGAAAKANEDSNNNSARRADKTEWKNFKTRALTQLSEIELKAYQKMSLVLKSQVRKVPMWVRGSLLVILDSDLASGIRV